MATKTDSKDFNLADINRLGYSNHIHAGSDVDALTNSNDIQHIRSGSNSITNNVYGINHRQTPLPVPMNKDHYGLTFFTRPQLNLSTENIANVRLFHKLLTSEQKSWQRFIRCTLDPRLGAGYDESGITCPFVDEEMAFIPVLTNNLITISGWKDINLNTYTSKAGQYKEEFSMVDSVSVDYSAYDVTASFRNLKGDPILSMFIFWNHYQSMVFEGRLSPYADFIVNNEIDYCTRIYRLVLDPMKRKVQRIAACGAAFPTAAPVGGVFDFANDKPYNDINAQINVPMRCLGFICEDDILIRTFNDTVGIFNKSLRISYKNYSGDTFSFPGYIKIPWNMLNYFNNRGYPFINPYTYELEWWIKADVYYNFVGNLENILTYIHAAAGTIETEAGSNLEANIDEEGHVLRKDPKEEEQEIMEQLDKIRKDNDLI